MFEKLRYALFLLLLIATLILIWIGIALGFASMQPPLFDAETLEILRRAWLLALLICGSGLLAAAKRQWIEEIIDWFRSRWR